MTGMSRVSGPPFNDSGCAWHRDEERVRLLGLCTHLCDGPLPRRSAPRTAAVSLTEPCTDNSHDEPSYDARQKPLRSCASTERTLPYTALSRQTRQESFVFWQVQQAKQRFSELVRRALSEGPQVVTRHGEPTVVVVAAEEYQRLRRQPPDLTAFLLDPSGPHFDVLDLDSLERDLPRDVEL